MFVACLALLVGCGSSGEPTFPVSGKVTYADGKPVEGAAVSFVPDSGSKPAVGITDADGMYKLTTTNKDDGAIAGDYKVTIASYEGSADYESTDEGQTLADPYDITNEYPEDYDEASQKSVASKNKLPAKYSNKATSGFTAQVKAEGENVYDFEIKTK